LMKAGCGTFSPPMNSVTARNAVIASAFPADAIAAPSESSDASPVNITRLMRHTDRERGRQCTDKKLQAENVGKTTHTESPLMRRLRTTRHLVPFPEHFELTSEQHLLPHFLQTVPQACGHTSVHMCESRHDIVPLQRPAHAGTTERILCNKWDGGGEGISLN
jgi:hypothetical protein